MMNEVTLVPAENIGWNFVPSRFIPEGEDEFHIRNMQVNPPKTGWRELRPMEIEVLQKNGNTAEDWKNVRVMSPFDPHQIRNTRFYGLVRIGRLRHTVIQHHDLRLPTGITDSMIVSCDIGDDAAIHNVRYLAHYIIGNQCILFNIDEMLATDHARFGNGILKEGEEEKSRMWLDLMNEAGCRKVLPFDGMTSADAYLWAKYRDDRILQEKLVEITQNGFDSRRGYYGTVGDLTVIKNSRIIKDVKIGSHSYIKGANKLKNLTIHSSEDEPSQVGEGVELVNGIIGYGCHIFYGCKAVKFILGNNSNLKYGARLINSFLGDNSTISCCEVLNNLIFPAHEQHHNNSFLVASLVMGQSNVAAGATIGSNHNSRANDNEIQAGRGFWPGLCTSLKHPSRFASFVLIAKADFPSELDIPLPFSLLSHHVSVDRLEVMPAFWWLYNMYALIRNTSKYHERDYRIRKVQHIEFEPLAPDTTEEIIRAMHLLEVWTARAHLSREGQDIRHYAEISLAENGRKLLSGEEDGVKGLEVLGENMEHSRRKVLILKPWQAYHAYRDMLYYYAGKNLLDYMKSRPDATPASMLEDLKGERTRDWVNMGGQIMKMADADALRSDIRSGELKTWEDIHKRYDVIWDRYPKDRQAHALAVLHFLSGTDAFSGEQWNELLDKLVQLQEYVSQQVYLTRKKDFNNPFRQVTFSNPEEVEATIGTVDDIHLIQQVRTETGELIQQIALLRTRSRSRHSGPETDRRGG